ncbi:cytochrome P450 [Aspergillus novofumigatus IBT 16806]|uniref:Cytochrome P450 n=1 Tax=Aspergillus novofumigatus (strain IBT 16806) TaxID=1392255 RepID=A0A2I1BV59_ASPN1|nr:cytochrome P450 [Aspergillus novofumigatus IBT 16806]PKX89262.1 cytochrome P450 [Aspergillus novofumigatus IBT 16806]
MGFVNTLTQASDLEKQRLRASPPVLKLFVLVLFVLVGLKIRARHRANRITNQHGRKIRELPGDARVSKFAFSQQLSDQGKAFVGEEPFIIRNGRARELVVTRPEHIYDFYKGDTKHHPKPPCLNMGSTLAVSSILGHAVGAIAGERWSMIRRYFDPEFSFQSARQAIPQLSGSINRWLDDLPLQGTGTEKGFALEIKKPCRFLPLRLAAEFLYGEVFDDERFSALLELNVLHEVILHDVIANKRLATRRGCWLDRNAAKRMEEFRSRWREFNVGIVQSARQGSQVCPAERIYHGVEKGDLKLEEFLHTLDEILFANVDVSSAVLNTLFEHLAANTAFQQKLRGEVEAHIQSRTHTPDTDTDTDTNTHTGKYLSKQDTLLNYAVMEAIRLSPAFAFSLPECTAVPKEIGDAKRLNADPATWGKDGDMYRPERCDTGLCDLVLGRRVDDVSGSIWRIRCSS